jgi:fluoride exporter
VGNVVLVFIGGALGSVARYLVASWAADAFGPGFPRGTLTVNVSGSFLIAVVLGLSLRGVGVSPNLRLFLTRGVMGGFTTYSSFNWETIRFLDDGEASYALAYVAATFGGCLGAGALGLVCARVLARLAAAIAV